jgi:hypothetical protein
MTYRHPKEFMHGTTRMVHVPVLLHWYYKGRSGKAPHEAVGMIEDGAEQFSLSDFWWFEGNGACDCNRADFIGLTQEEFPELYRLDHNGEMDTACGDKIYLLRIESLDPEVESLAGEILPVDDLIRREG